MILVLLINIEPEFASKDTFNLTCFTFYRNTKCRNTANLSLDHGSSLNNISAQCSLNGSARSLALSLSGTPLRFRHLVLILMLANAALTSAENGQTCVQMF